MDRDYLRAWITLGAGIPYVYPFVVAAWFLAVYLRMLGSRRRVEGRTGVDPSVAEASTVTG